LESGGTEVETERVSRTQPFMNFTPLKRSFFQLNKKIRFLGHIDNEYIISVFACLVVYLIISQFVGIPLVIKEEGKQNLSKLVAKQNSSS
jgi:hypothetical protein